MFAVLHRPHVLRLLTSSLVGRLPSAAIGLLLILRTRELHGSYAIGGIAGGAFAFGSAATGPALGRLIDRRGTRAVLSGCIVVATAGWLLVAALPPGSPPWLVIVGGLIAGAANPPLSATLRTVWSRLLPGRDELHQVLSLEATFQEIIYIVGPVVLVTGVAAFSSRVAFVLGAAMLVAGSVLFAFHPEAHGGEVVASASRERPLRVAAVRRIIGVILTTGASFSAIEIATTSLCEDAGQRNVTGAVLAVWAFGSAIGGLLVARSATPPDRDARLRLILLLLASATALPTLAVLSGAIGTSWTGVGAYALILIVPGLAIAPTFPLIYGLAADAAPASAQTETFTWLASAVIGGNSLGTALGGAAISVFGGPAAALAVATGAAGAAWLITALPEPPRARREPAAIAPE